MPPVMTVLLECKFNIGPLLAHRVAAESDNQSDCEQDDINDFPPLDPWDDIDNIEPTLLPSTKKRPCSPTFDEIVACSKKPHTGPHHRCAQTPLSRATLLSGCNLASSTLPATLGVYAAKVEDGMEQHGSKAWVSVVNMPRLLLDGCRHIITVLASRSAGKNYHVAALTAFSICNAGTKVQLPASMHKHCHGLFAAIAIGRQ
ncbi:hypothetical protein K438DRAFT_2028781 [Mycena galopus ATCC 62051]|nr:hypothetical protein K438DRAFT_2028781 [Mycena galopus ATCC 62051]